jgi:hypothetical protein
VGPGDAESPKVGPDGVPTWSNAAGGGAKTAPMGKPAAKPAARPAKPAAKDEDDLSKIIADLSESDFDIDFGEDDEPKKK